MYIKFVMSVQQARHLARLLHKYRLSLSVCDNTATWRNVGDPSSRFSLDDILLLEDVRSTLTNAVDDAIDQVVGSPFIVTK